MRTQVDLLIINASQIATCASPGGPKRGAALRDVGLIERGAVACKDGLIVDAGPTDALAARYQADETIDAGGRAVIPGLVDPHTHVVYAGDRVGEFELRIQGASYMEIMAAGGGIVSTMKATRAASVEELAESARPRLDAMLALGTTTAEIKSGYGLETGAELRMLQAAAELDARHPMDIVPTFLGAHAVPPEHAGRTDDYTNVVIQEMIPAAVEWYEGSSFAARGVPLFNDVFCEQNAFDVAQSRRVLEAGLARGLPVKAHVDEFTPLGGLSLAVELGAVSADHLDATTPEEGARLAGSPTVGVVLPAVNFNLGSAHFADARRLIDAGAALALATDINPGSAPCPSMPLVMAMACRYQRLLPAEALNAATINAAHALALGDRIGSIEAGKQADLLILDAADYRHLAYEFGGNLVRTVIKRGRIVRQNQ
jgi:imidazolonepropionase